MTRQIALGVLLLVGSSVALLGAEPPQRLDFATDIAPLFEAKCNRCHGASRKGGGLDLRSYESTLKGGVSGPSIVPGQAAKSLLIELIHYDEMPPRREQPRVTPSEFDRLKAWVNGLK